MKRRSNTVVYFFIFALIVANFFIYSKIFTNSIPEPSYAVSDGNINDNGDSGTDTPDSSDASGNNQGSALSPDYKYITANVSDTYSGPLVLVNSSHEFKFDNAPTVVEKSINDSVYYNKTSGYSVKDTNVTMDTVAISALNKMMDDFYAHMGNKKTIIITEGLRTFEKQQEILAQKIEQYGADQSIAQQPGFSEHHTGYAMDINLYIDGVMDTFTGEGEYSWIPENAYKYGFILRYPEGKETKTGISYEPWHFRYVGTAHAQYMHDNNLTLEEYIDTLALYPFESEHLKVTDQATSAQYEIYSVAVTSDGTKVPVPSALEGTEYTLSGDNAGHIIVTVKKAES